MCGENVISIKKIIKKVFGILPIKNIIVMESNPDFTDNTKLVFDKLIEKKVNGKYKIIWFVNDSKKFKDNKIKNVKFISAYSKYNILKILRRLYYNATAKIIIDCNKYIPKIKKEQFRLYLTHGTPLKNTLEYGKGIGDIDYILEISEFFKEKNSEIFRKPKECFLNLGFPRNDELFIQISANEIFPQCNSEKNIVWLPTYRKHKDKVDMEKSNLRYGLPVLNSEEDFAKVDKVLNENNIMLFIKLHPAEDTSFIKSFNCKNIKLINDEDLAKKGFNLYQFLAASDALITDYSAVYYDYLLTKKPIALAISDIEDFKEKHGLFYDYYQTVKGHYVYNAKDLYEFIKNLAQDNDVYFGERQKCLEKYHTFYDDKSSERVYEFIKKYL